MRNGSIDATEAARTERAVVESIQVAVAPTEGATCALSVVIPALNEVQRLPLFLMAVRRHLDNLRLSYEVVVVDDGSRDGTDVFVERLAQDWSVLRLARHGDRRGKGAALRTGIAAARGRWILLTDADGATPITEEARLRAALSADADLAVGSRILPDDAVLRSRQPTRSLMGRLFAVCAKRILRLPVSDPQCGFKLLRAERVKEFLPLCDESGYLFDAQLLLYASRQGLRIVDVPVCWHEVPGSKVRRFRDGGRMLYGLFRLRRSNHDGRLDRACRNIQATTPSGSA